MVLIEGVDELTHFKRYPCVQDNHQEFKIVDVQGIDWVNFRWFCEEDHGKAQLSEVLFPDSPHEHMFFAPSAEAIVGCITCPRKGWRSPDE